MRQWIQVITKLMNIYVLKESYSPILKAFQHDFQRNRFRNRLQFA
jgi:hypothetical protein